MASRIIEYVDDGGAQLMNELSIGTPSDAATLDDNPGPGRTVDKALIWGGRYVERAVTWAMVRAGRGPTGPMKEIMRHMYQELQKRCGGPHRCRKPSCHCEWISDVYEVTAPPLAPTLPSVCDWLGYAMSAAPSCPKCGTKQWTPRDGFHLPLLPVRKLVKLLTSTNPSSRYISLHMLTLLGTFLPVSREVFSNLQVEGVLHELFRAMTYRVDIDPLLASCRRALVTISEVEVLLFGKILHRQNWSEITHYEVIPKLLAYISDPEKRLLSLSILHERPWMLQDNSAEYDPDMMETMYLEMLERAASSDDIVELTVITNCFYKLTQHNSSLTFCLFLVPTIKENPELLDQLPPRLRCIIEDIPVYFEQVAVEKEKHYGRHVNEWRREIWHHDPDDPEGEPDDDWHLYKWAARSDGGWGYGKIDDVWWESPALEPCESKNQILEAALERGAPGEEEEEGLGRRERRAQSVPITARQQPWYRPGTYNGEPTYFCAEYP